VIRLVDQIVANYHQLIYEGEHGFPEQYRVYTNAYDRQRFCVIMLIKGIFYVKFLTTSSLIGEWKRFNQEGFTDIIDFEFFDDSENVNLEILCSDHSLIIIKLKDGELLENRSIMELNHKIIERCYYNHLDECYRLKFYSRGKIYNIKDNVNEYGQLVKCVTEHVDKHRDNFRRKISHHETLFKYYCKNKEKIFLTDDLTLIVFMDNSEINVASEVDNFHFDSKSFVLYFLKDNKIYALAYNYSLRLGEIKLLFIPEDHAKISFSVTSEHDEKLSRPIMTKSAAKR